MNGLELIASLAASFAWPVAMMCVVILLRAEFKSIFARLAERMANLKSITGPAGTSAEFESGLLDAKQKIGAIKTADEDNQQPTERAVTRFVTDELREMAELSPRAAIIEAWISLESALRYLYQKLGGDDRYKTSTVRMIGRIRERFAPHPKFFEAMDATARLAQLRNVAVHERDFTASRLDAFEYAESAGRLAQILTDYANNITRSETEALGKENETRAS